MPPPTPKGTPLPSSHRLRARRAQLTPYTALKVKSFEPSPDLEVQPHRIVISVAPDNKVPPEDLPLAPWS